MAAFRAQLDARRLLKRLTASPPTESATSQKYEKTRRDNSTVSCHLDTLNKKYEELGRLLALQHLEKNVLSSVGNSDVLLASKSSPSKRRRSKRGNSQGAGKSSRNIRNKSPAGSGRRVNDDDDTAVPGFVFVRIPQVISEDPSVEEPRRESPRSPKVRPKSARAKLSKSKKRSSNSSSGDRMRQYGIPSRYLDEDDNTTSGRFDNSSSRYMNSNGHEEEEDVTFVEHDDSAGDYIFELPQSEELIYDNEEFEDSSPLFVIQGEVEVTETVTYERPTEGKGARVVDVNETVTYDRPTKNDQSRIVDVTEVSPQKAPARTKSKKTVSFCESSDEETTTDRINDAESRKDEDSLKYETEDSLNIVLEKEILAELLQSPRPGLYQNNRFEKEAKITKSKAKKRKLRRKSRNEDGVGELSNSKGSSPDLQNCKDSPRVSDCKLDNTGNPAIKLWLRRKNKLIRQQKKAERKKEKNEKLVEHQQQQERIEKHFKSEEVVAEWEDSKKREVRERVKAEKKVRKAIKKREEEEFMKKKKENELKEERKIGNDIGQVGKAQQTGKRKTKRKKSRKSKVHPGESEDGRETLQQKANLQKRVTYDEWLTKKRTNDKKIKLKQEKQISRDHDLDGIIPSLGKERIDRATRTRGRRRLVSDADKTREESEQSDLPESDQKHQNPFKVPGEGGDGWVKTLGSDAKRPTSSRNASPMSSKGIRKTKKDRPTSAKHLLSSSNVVEGRRKDTKYAWDSNDKVQDSGCETLNSDSSNVGCHGKVADSKEEKDEGIFLTESMS